MRCLVTGANGHLGNNLVRALLEQGHTVRAGMRNTNNRAPFAGLDCELVYAEFQDQASLLKALEGSGPISASLKPATCALRIRCTICRWCAL